MKKSAFTVFEKPLETLARDKTKMPNLEALKLYREVLKFS